MDLELKGKTVVVTGTGSHIGRAIALGFAREGCNVSMLELDDERGKKVAEEVKKAATGGTLLFRTDVTNPEQVQKAVNDTLQKFGSVDVLVNDVGAGTYGPFVQKTYESIDKEIKLNLWSQIYCMRAVLPHMLKKNAGVIVNVASHAGVQGYADLTTYSTSKFAVIGLTQALSRELGPLGIRLNCVAPGSIPPVTGDYRGRHLKFADREQDILARACVKRIGKPEDIADAVLFLASARSGYIIGQTLSVDGGFTFH